MTAAKLPSLTSALLLILNLSGMAAAQRQDLQFFTRVRVLADTREDVERIYGKGQFENNPYFVTYQQNRIEIAVDYSLGDCSVKNAIWNAPEWAVTEITYSFLKNPPTLRSLIKDTRNFKERIAGDVLNHIEYYNSEKGIAITYDKDRKKVLHVVITPGSSSLDRKCKD